MSDSPDRSPPDCLKDCIRETFLWYEVKMLRPSVVAQRQRRQKHALSFPALRQRICANPVRPAGRCDGVESLYYVMDHHDIL